MGVADMGAADVDAAERRIAGDGAAVDRAAGDEAAVDRAAGDGLREGRCVFASVGRLARASVALGLVLLAGCSLGGGGVVAPSADELARRALIAKAEAQVLEASSSGDVALLEAALAQEGVSVDVRDESGRTGLILASLRDHHEITTRLLRAGADPSLEDDGLGSALGVASREAHLDVMRVLLATGLHPDLGSHQPLFLAARAGNNDAVTMLIESGADLDRRTDAPGIRSTPLIGALRGEHSDTALLLLRRGAAARRTNTLEVSPLSVAVRSSMDEAVVALAVSGADVNEPFRDESLRGFAPIHLVAQSNDVDLLHDLIVLGADIEQRVLGNGSTPLMVAVVSDAVAVSRVLLEHGADWAATLATDPQLESGDMNVLMIAGVGRKRDAAAMLKRAGAGLGGPNAAAERLFRQADTLVRGAKGSAGLAEAAELYRRAFVAGDGWIEPLFNVAATWAEIAAIHDSDQVARGAGMYLDMYEILLAPKQDDRTRALRTRINAQARNR